MSNTEGKVFLQLVMWVGGGGACLQLEGGEEARGEGVEVFVLPAAEETAQGGAGLIHQAPRAPRVGQPVHRHLHMYTSCYSVLSRDGFFSVSKKSQKRLEGSSENLDRLQSTVPY